MDSVRTGRRLRGRGAASTLMEETGNVGCTECGGWMTARCAGVVGFRRETVHAIMVLKCRLCIMVEKEELARKGKAMKKEIKGLKNKIERLKRRLSEDHEEETDTTLSSGSVDVSISMGNGTTAAEASVEDNEAAGMDRRVGSESIETDTSVVNERRKLTDTDKNERAPALETEGEDEQEVRVDSEQDSVVSQDKGVQTETENEGSPSSNTSSRSDQEGSAQLENGVGEDVGSLRGSLGVGRVRTGRQLSEIEKRGLEQAIGQFVKERREVVGREGDRREQAPQCIQSKKIELEKVIRKKKEELVVLGDSLIDRTDREMNMGGNLRRVRVCLRGANTVELMNTLKKEDFEEDTAYSVIVQVSGNGLQRLGAERVVREVVGGIQGVAMKGKQVSLIICGVIKRPAGGREYERERRCVNMELSRMVRQMAEREIEGIVSLKYANMEEVGVEHIGRDGVHLNSEGVRVMVGRYWEELGVGRDFAKRDRGSRGAVSWRSAPEQGERESRGGHNVGRGRGTGSPRGRGGVVGHRMEGVRQVE